MMRLGKAIKENIILQLTIIVLTIIAAFIFLLFTNCNNKLDTLH